MGTRASEPIVEAVLRFEDLPLGSAGTRRAVVRWSDGTEDAAMTWYGDLSRCLDKSAYAERRVMPGAVVVVAVAWRFWGLDARHNQRPSRKARSVIGRSVSAGLRVGWGGSGECSLFDRHVGVDVDLCGFDRFVAQPQARSRCCRRRRAGGSSRRCGAARGARPSWSSATGSRAGGGGVLGDEQRDRVAAERSAAAWLGTAARSGWPSLSAARRAARRRSVVVSGVARCLRPFPWHRRARRCRGARPGSAGAVSSETRSPVWIARVSSAWSRRPIQRSRSGAASSASTSSA